MKKIQHTVSKDSCIAFQSVCKREIVSFLRSVYSCSLVVSQHQRARQSAKQLSHLQEIKLKRRDSKFV